MDTSNPGKISGRLDLDLCSYSEHGFEPNAVEH